MKLFLSLLLGIVCFTTINGQTNTNTSIARSTIGVAGASEKIEVNNTTYIIQQSIGQTSVIGTHKNDTHILRQGFIQADVWDDIADDSIPLDLNVTLYPNPFASNINLAFNEQINTAITVVVFNMSGKMVMSKDFRANQIIAIEANQLTATNYIIRVTANKKQFIRHVLKK